MRTARPGWTSGNGLKAQKQEHISKTTYSAVSALPQVHAQLSLDRLARYRAALDSWRVAGAGGQLPQPADYGLRLPALRAEQVAWRAT